MKHWSQRFVGEPYVSRENDCAVLAERVQREIFKRDIRLPTERAVRGMGFAEQIDSLKADYACRVTTPIEGDAVIMYCRGRPSHIGIYCEIAGEAWVLHAVRNAGQVMLTRVRELEAYGLAVEGYYRWI